MSDRLLLGIDAGGTFTDFVLLRETKAKRELTIHKVPSTPRAPEQAILQGIRDLGLEDEVKIGRLRIIHGSTVATNAALEGKGAATVFITNHGFADMLTLGRQTRPALYQLEFPRIDPPVSPDHCLEVGGRLAADGSELEPLLDSELAYVCARIEQLQPQAVAINLLFSFLEDRFERAIEEALEKLALPLFISRSSEVLPEYKEYERGIATWLNASLGPIINGYLSRLSDQLGQCPLMIMQSSGETLTAANAARRAVNLLLSGPAAGLAAINNLAQQLPGKKLLSFDMGGTSTDVALIDGGITITNEGHIANYPVAVPMVDMHTIGAGGGSIAFIDAGGMLQVGPKSAGSEPGPACYGKGGLAVTVTDANLVLGRLTAGSTLAGGLNLDLKAALAAINQLAAGLNLSSEETALGIIEIADEHMANALRIISVQRGYDPKDFILASFGGAGGLHVCSVAQSLGVKNAMVPIHAGVLSALGMLVAPQGAQYSRTVHLLGSTTEEVQLQSAMKELATMGIAELAAQGLDIENLNCEYSVDICYSGQSSTLNLPWQTKIKAIKGFNELHEKRYGFSLKREVEFVNLRVRVTARLTPPEIFATASQQHRNNSMTNEVYRGKSLPAVLERNKLQKGQIVLGPAVVVEPSATTFIQQGWSGRTDSLGNLWLEQDL